VTGEETFQFAAAIAGVVMGLVAITILAIVAVVGVWQLFRRANEAAAAATRASLGAEELARHVATQLMAQPRGNGGQLADLRQQAETLLDQERELQERARSLLDSAAIEGSSSPAALSDVEMAINRLDSTVGQMAASLANLIQLLERQQKG
jgi:ABC-type transporter Mla subunit MlaD